MFLQSIRFVDRDMVMRYHWGLAVGHVHTHHQQSSHPGMTWPDLQVNCSDNPMESGTMTEASEVPIEHNQAGSHDVTHNKIEAKQNLDRDSESDNLPYMPDPDDSTSKSGDSEESNDSQILEFDDMYGGIRDWESDEED